MIKTICLLFLFAVISTCFAGDTNNFTDEDLDAVKHEQDQKMYQHIKKLKDRRELENNIKSIHEALVDLNEDRIEELKECRFFDLANEMQCEESVIRKYEKLFSDFERYLRELEEAYSKIKKQ